MLLAALALLASCAYPAKVGTYLDPAFPGNSITVESGNALSANFGGDRYQISLDADYDGAQVVEILCNGAPYGNLVIGSDVAYWTDEMNGSDVTVFSCDYGDGYLYLWLPGADYTSFECWWNDTTIGFAGQEFQLQ